MSEPRQCRRCGQELPPDQLRYIAKIQVYAAYDPLEITFEDLRRDHTAEIDALLQRCAELSEEELMRDVYVAFQFDLCRVCQKAYVADPVPALWKA